MRPGRERQRDDLVVQRGRRRGGHFHLGGVVATSPQDEAEERGSPEGDSGNDLGSVTSAHVSESSWIRMVGRGTSHGNASPLSRSASLLQGIGDRGLPPALEAVHQDCAREWTVVEFARVAGTSPARARNAASWPPALGARVR